MKSMKWTKLHEMDMEMYEVDETNGYMMNQTAGYGWKWMEWMNMDEMDGNGVKSTSPSSDLPHSTLQTTFPCPCSCQTVPGLSGRL